MGQKRGNTPVNARFFQRLTSEPPSPCRKPAGSGQQSPPKSMRANERATIAGTGEPRRPFPLPVVETSPKFGRKRIGNGSGLQGPEPDHGRGFGNRNHATPLLRDPGHRSLGRGTDRLGGTT